MANLFALTADLLGRIGGFVTRNSHRLFLANHTPTFLFQLMGYVLGSGERGSPQVFRTESRTIVLVTGEMAQVGCVMAANVSGFWTIYVFVCVWVGELVLRNVSGSDIVQMILQNQMEKLDKAPPTILQSDVFSGVVDKWTVAPFPICPKGGREKAPLFLTVVES